MTTHTLTSSRRIVGSALVAAMFVGGWALSPISRAGAATTGTATLLAGSLGLTSPATVSFGATLNGVDQSVTSTQSLDVLDSTGSGLGWNVTATSTAFKTAGTDTLAITAVTEQLAPVNTCDASSTCTLATTNVAYPYTLPAGPTAPTATKIFNATAATGLGNQTSVHTLRLAIPSGAKAGVYSSTWTYSVISGP